jgi:hypothetical protein
MYILSAWLTGHCVDCELPLALSEHVLYRRPEEVYYKDSMKVQAAEIVNPWNSIYRLLTAVRESPIYAILVSELRVIRP